MLSLKELQDRVKLKVIDQNIHVNKFCTVFYKYLIKQQAHNFGCEFNSSTSCLLIGNSGSGKTYMVREAAKVFDVPFIEINAKSICQEGWAGNSFIDLIEQGMILHLQETKKDNTFIPTIIFIDEFDKLLVGNFTTKGENLAFHLQASILKYIEGMEMFLKSFKRTINTKNWMFIFAGAFSGLQEKEVINIGFTKQKPDKKKLIKSLENYGMLPEIAGRLQEIIQLNSISENGYKKLLNSEFFVLNQWRELLRRFDITFKIPYTKLIKKAIESDLGVRGLIQQTEYLITNIINKNLDKMHIEKLTPEYLYAERLKNELNDDSLNSLNLFIELFKDGNKHEGDSDERN